MKIKDVVCMCSMWWLFLIHLVKIWSALGQASLHPHVVCSHSNAVEDNLGLLILCFYMLVISNAYVWLTFPRFPLQKEVERGREFVPFSLDILFDQPVTVP